MTPTTTSWAIIEFERGHYAALPNSFARIGIACVIPMVTDYNHKAKVEIRRPALQNLAFIPALEHYAQIAMDRIRYVDEVWRGANGNLRTIPDRELQAFLDRLERREKKPDRIKKTLNLGALAEKDGFTLIAHLFGVREAIKRFGRDMREQEVV